MVKLEDMEKTTRNRKLIDDNVSNVRDIKGDKFGEAITLVSSIKPMREVLEDIIGEDGISIGRIGDIRDEDGFTTGGIEDFNEECVEYTPDYIKESPYTEYFPNGKDEVLKGIILIIEEIWNKKIDYELSINDEYKQGIMGEYIIGRKIITLKYKEE